MGNRRIRGIHSAAQAETASGTMHRRRFRMSKRLVYIICTLLALLIVAASAMVIRGVRDRKKYNQYMDSASISYAQQDYDSALAGLRKACAIDKTDECIMMMADCYEAQGRLDKALELLRSGDTKKKEIADRISELERKRAAAREEGKLSLAGGLYDVGTSALRLDGAGLRDSDLDIIRQMYALDTLSLSGNRLRDISALAELGGLCALDLSNNRIEDISPLASLSSLRTLCLDGNPIKDLTPLTNITSLTALSIKGMQLDRETVEMLTNALPNCAIHTDAEGEAVTDISFGGETFKSDVTELSLSAMGIRDISALSVCTQLTQLDLSGNEISDLSPLMNIPTLEWLDISGNQVTDLRTLMGIDSLRYLNASDNMIGDTSPFCIMTGIRELYLDGNPIRNFSGLRKLISLEKLGLCNAGVTDADLEYLYDLGHLTQLFISDNEQLSGEAIDLLQQKINPCNITHSGLIYTIWFGENSFKSNAAELELSYAGVDDIGAIQSMTQLETVRLTGNGIVNIYPIEYSNSRFTIKTMELNNNCITDITALASLQNVEEMDLSNNAIESVMPLMTLTSLKRLNLSGNNISESQIKDLRYALSKCEIISDYD